MNGTHTNLWLSVLDPEFHKQTCGYWYTVTSRGTAHTAFRTEAGLLKWLSERGLRLTAPLTPAGVPSSQRIDGVYAATSHMSPAEFEALKPVLETRDLSNGAWTLAKVTEGSDGIRTVHTLNPNVPRVTFDPAESNALMDGAK